eukprot:TRINITY_DN373_c1_g1_i2.p1 TRINITY_DN373_c1_g1~~TRINITY_DN373_c1_g1_i2.p1  ORF type:complete len:482 (+),score=158.86 TRINITY_DN373_c1_g1_i2:35-1447(+)
MVPSNISCRSPSFSIPAMPMIPMVPKLETVPAPPMSLVDMPVLIVDDNLSNRRALGNMLTSWQMVPSMSDSGEMAIAMLHQALDEGRPYKLILLDAQMPVLDGFAVAELLKQDPRLSLGARVLMMTSAGQRGDSVQNAGLGISAYVTKPVSHSDLLNALRDEADDSDKEEKRSYAKEKEKENPKEKTGPQKNSAATQEEPHEVRKTSILLAEDNPVNQKLAIRLLERLGYMVTLAENGLQAVTAYDRTTFDIILMDVQMPEMGGFEATGIIRRREAQGRRKTPIIAMTAHALQGDREKCLEAGMDDYLSKPIRAEQLKLLIEKHLALSSNFQEGTPLEERPERAEPVVPAQTASQMLEAVLSEAAPVFLTQYPHMLSKLELAISTHNSDLLYRSAHSLKGALSSFSIEASKAALDLELVGKHHGSFKDAQHLFEVLTKEIDKLLPTIKSLAEYYNTSSGNSKKGLDETST